MIGGYDTLIVTSETPRIVIWRFLGLLSKRWPNLRANIGGVSVSNNPLEISWYQLPENGDIHIVRDKRMEKHFDVRGMRLMNDGEGPISIWYDETGDEPYEITLVSPDDPEEDSFSGEIWKLLIESCGDRFIESYVLKED